MSITHIDTSARRALMFTPMETRRDVLVEAAVLADRLGYEAVTVPEGWGLDAGIVLAEMAVRTERIRLVSGVFSVWGRTPATLAMTAAALDDLSGGRFTLGLGASTPVLAERFHGEPFVDAAGRLDRTARDVRTLLGGGRVPAPDGSNGLSMGRDPRPDVPIWVAALGPRSTAVAVGRADAWFPAVMPRDHLGRQRRELAGGPGDPEVVCGPMLAVGSDRCSAAAAAEQLVGWYLTGMGRLYGDLAVAAGHGAAVEALRAANPRPVPGGVVWPRTADPLLEQLVAGLGQDLGADLAAWDAEADLVAVGVGPGTRADVLAAVEAAAPGAI